MSMFPCLRLVDVSDVWSGEVELVESKKGEKLIVI